MTLSRAKEACRLRRRYLAQYILVASLLTGVPSQAQVPVITKDPLKDYVRVVLEFNDEPFLLRAFLKGGKSNIDLYIIKRGHDSETRYRTATVRWIDGSLRKPVLNQIDTNFDCGSVRYGGRCRATQHMSISITEKSWNSLAKWAKQTPDGVVEFQLQSNYSDVNYGFNLKANQILRFGEALSEAGK